MTDINPFTDEKAILKELNEAKKVLAKKENELSLIHFAVDRAKRRVEAFTELYLLATGSTPRADGRPLDA